MAAPPADSVDAPEARQREWRQQTDIDALVRSVTESVMQAIAEKYALAPRK